MNHLDGIRVLSEEVVREVSGTGVLYIILAFIISVIVAIFITNWNANKSEFIFAGIGLLVLFIAFILSIKIKPLNDVVYKEYKEYEVLIDKSVGYKEFEDTYEVTGHNGEIYKVKFRG